MRRPLVRPLVRFAIARCLALVCGCLASVASAHPSDVIHLTVTPDGHNVTMLLRAVGPVAEGPTASVHAPSFVFAESCKPGPVSASRSTALEVAWSMACRDAPSQIAVGLRALLVDSGDTAVVTIQSKPPHELLLTGDKPTATVELRSPSKTVSVADWLISGMTHIWLGWDHLLFVLLLLLGVACHAPQVLGSLRNEPVPIGARCRALAVRISLFTVAHSITLIGAALGLVSAPSRWVEVAIAVTLVWTAVRLWRGVRGEPYGLILAFGGIHGFGFASVLAELLPDRAVTPLVLFNVGIEIGQLAAMLALAPAFWWASARLGPERTSRWLIRPLAAAIAALGLFWVVQRSL